MIALSAEISCLITYRQQCENRLDNLNYILSMLGSVPRTEIILVEQDKVPTLSRQALPENGRYIFVRNTELFNKSWGLNIAAQHAKSKYLIFSDADVLIEREALEKIREYFEQGMDAINPYDCLIDLDEAETQALLAGRPIDINRASDQTNRSHLGQQVPFCGGVFAITRDLFDRTGGMDERFEGWGGDDDAMSHRVDHFSAQPVTFKHRTAYHLWHPSTAQLTNDSPHYLRNIALLSSYYEYPSNFYTTLAAHDSNYIGRQDKYIYDSTELPPPSDMPLVSCLCVTRLRVDFLTRAIRCFENQTYPNRELLIVCEDDDKETIHFAKQFQSQHIHLHIISSTPKQTLGALRNLSIKLANGEYICQWDDDDWYHPKRIEHQLNSARQAGKAASILPRWLIYTPADERLYCSSVRLWEGSILCRTDMLNAAFMYGDATKGEDTTLIANLYIEDQLAISDQPDLYVYTYSGENTWDDAHFKKILDASQLLDSLEAARLIQRIKIE